MGSGAWPPLVSLVNSVKERDRDLNLLNSYADPDRRELLRGTIGIQPSGWQ